MKLMQANYKNNLQWNIQSDVSFRENNYKLNKNCIFALY